MYQICWFLRISSIPFLQLACWQRLVADYRSLMGLGCTLAVGSGGTHVCEKSAERECNSAPLWWNQQTGCSSFGHDPGSTSVPVPRQRSWLLWSRWCRLTWLAPGCAAGCTGSGLWLWEPGYRLTCRRCCTESCRCWSSWSGTQSPALCSIWCHIHLHCSDFLHCHFSSLCVPSSLFSPCSSLFSPCCEYRTQQQSEEHKPRGEIKFI